MIQTLLSVIDLRFYNSRALIWPGNLSPIRGLRMPHGVVSPYAQLHHHHHGRHPVKQSPMTENVGLHATSFVVGWPPGQATALGSPRSRGTDRFLILWPARVRQVGPLRGRGDTASGIIAVQDAHLGFSWWTIQTPPSWTPLDPLELCHSLCFHGPHPASTKLGPQSRGPSCSWGCVFLGRKFGQLLGALGPQDVPLAPGFHTAQSPL